ncbi:Protein ALP1-like [Frankliniella fusca]|uniref:Protein ALP1-like n=1 Tax=Frankliniella fusca TaxID=407009 RepID=A0AAE1HCT6_9NEOP|nr:Protein ALP1-like [Frankliniella fusca]
MGRFIDVCIGFPGSCHDMRVLRHSGLFRAGVYPPRGYFIIGDGGYQCLRNPITLITPYRNVNLTPDQLSFNFHLSKARSVVERTFGLLQARFRVMYHRALEVDTYKEDTRSFGTQGKTNVVQGPEAKLTYFWTPRKDSRIEVKFPKAVKVITAACVLHNICIDAEDFVDYTVHPRRGQQILRNEEAGEAYRNILCLAHNVGRRQALLERQLD